MDISNSKESDKMNAQTMPKVGDLFIYDGFLATVIYTYNYANSFKIGFYDIIGNYEERYICLDQLTDEELHFGIGVEKVKEAYAKRHNLLVASI